MVSHLICPATVIVARHGDAAYDVVGVPSDDGGWLTELGRRQALSLAASLVHRRIAAVWSSDMARAMQTAEIVTGRLNVPTRITANLRELSVGSLAGRADGWSLVEDVYARWLDGDLSASCPDAESGADVVRRVRGELEAAADEFRGETMLIISHGGALSLTVPLLARNVPANFARGRSLVNCATCELSVDADGWLLGTWGDRPV